MFKNAWEEIISWFNSDKYKSKEELYYLEIAKAQAILTEMENIEEDDDMKEWNKELLNAWTEWIKGEPKVHGTNSWTEDSMGKMNFIESMYRSIRGLEKPEDIARTLITKLEEQAHSLHDNVDYKEQRGKKIFELEKDLRKEYDKRKKLIHELREYKEQRYRDMKEKMSEEQLARLVENREMLYGMFANEDMFKERIFDWIKDCMNEDSQRLVECGSDLATRCEDIAQDTMNEDMCNRDDVWDIARDVIDDTDWHDIAYDHELTNRDEVREIISEEFKENLDDYIDTDKPLDDYIQNLSGEKIQEQVKKHLLKFLRLLTNDLSQKGPTTDKAITVTEEKEEKSE